MKYDITYACGHTGAVNICGTAAERQKKLEWYQTSAVCPDCYRAEKEAEASAECEEVEMKYSEYKNGYADCKTKSGSYDPETKTIVVYVPRTEIIEDAPAALEDVVEIVSDAVVAPEDIVEIVNDAVAEAINSNNPVYCKVIAAGYTWRISFRVKDDGSASLTRVTWNPAENGDFGTGLTLEENTVFRFLEEAPPDTNDFQDFVDWSYRQWLEYEEDPHSGYVAVGTINLDGISIGDAVACLAAHTQEFFS